METTFGGGEAGDLGSVTIYDFLNSELIMFKLILLC